MTLSVLTREPGGLYAERLDALGPVGDVRFSSRWPYGCASFSCRLGVPVDFAHPALRPGRWLEVYDGLSLVWAGILAEPERGEPWMLAANGWASLADDYAALSTDVATSLTGAVGRGLPWLLDGVTLAAVGADGRPMMLDEQLDAATLAVGKRWAVFADRFFRATADPTSPSYAVIDSDTPGGRSIDGYVTHLYALYIDSVTGQPTQAGPVVSPTLAPDLGRYERYLDLTGAGPLTLAAAQSILAGRLAVNGAQLPPFSGSLTIPEGAVLTLSGQPARLSTVRAGVMVEVRGAAQDPASGAFTYATTVRFVVGECEYSDGRLRLTPVQTQRRDITAALSGEPAGRR